ncbi:hypothetical protein SFRURICE_004535, partial [Spodoptera frugiperda]
MQALHLLASAARLMRWCGHSLSTTWICSSSTSQARWRHRRYSVASVAAPAWLRASPSSTDSSDSAARPQPASARARAAPDTTYPKSCRNPRGNDISALHSSPAGFHDGLIFHRGVAGAIMANFTKHIRTSSAVEASMRRFFNLPISNSGTVLHSKSGISQSSVSNSLGMSIFSSSMLTGSFRIVFNCSSDINFFLIVSAESPICFFRYSSILSIGSLLCDIARSTFNARILRASCFRVNWAGAGFGADVDSNNAYQPISTITDNTAGIEMELLQVGSEPVGIRCPYCYEDVMTRAQYKNTTLTHTIAIILGIFFWWLCCCIIPYVVKRWKNVEHYCPNCR